MAVTTPNRRLQQLRQQVKESAANRPGTYRVLGESGEVIYIGKSKRVRTRLLSYFRAKDGDKARRIMGEAHALSWSYEASEFAALLRELELIRRHRPRFNVQYKRDALFSFLKLAGGAAPKLYVVRTVADDAATYFGPFRGGSRIVDAVRELNDLLELRDCKLSTPIRFADQTDLFSHQSQPACHRYELKRCLAPCAGLCTAAEYLARVEMARGFFEGDIDEPLRRLNQRMLDAAERWEFEHAALLRDRARRLERLRDDFGRLRHALDTLSFLYPIEAGDDGTILYVIRRGTVRAVVQAPSTAAERRKVRKLVERCFGAPGDQDGGGEPPPGGRDPAGGALVPEEPGRARANLPTGPGRADDRRYSAAEDRRQATRFADHHSQGGIRVINVRRLAIAASLVAAVGCRDGAPAAGAGAAAAPADSAVAAADTADPYGTPAADNVLLVEAEVEMPGLPASWSGARVGVLSDLRLGAWEENEAVAARAVQRLVAADPDVVVLLGNLAVDEAGAGALARVLAPLQGRPILAVLGDADVQTEALRTRVTSALAGIGATLLNNSRAPVAIGGGHPVHRGRRSGARTHSRLAAGGDHRGAGTGSTRADAARQPGAGGRADARRGRSRSSSAATPSAATWPFPARRGWRTCAPSSAVPAPVTA